MKTHQKKELKKWPYKSRDISNLRFNLPRITDIKKAMDNYALVDSKGKIIEKFRTKATAIQMKEQMQRNYFGEELKIVRIEDLE